MKKHHLLLLLVSGMMLVNAACAESENGLAAALRATVTRHPALSGKQANVAAKVFTGDSTRAQRYPSLSGQVATQGSTDPKVNAYYNNASYNGNRPMTFRARQPVWAFGRIDSNIAYADADVTAEKADLLRVQRQLMDQTVTAYVQVQGAQKRQRIAEDYVASLDKLYQQIQRREQGQMASMADVRLALARLLQARAQQDRYRSEVVIAENDLLSLTQIPVHVDHDVPDSMTHLPGDAELEELAQQQSADVVLKTRQAALAQAEVRRELSSSMPTLYLEADRYLNQAPYGGDFRVGVTLEAALDGLGFASHGRNMAADARRQAALDELNATRNEISRTVRSLNANRQLQQSLIRSQNQSVKELAEILDSYQRQYEAGYKAWLEVLNMLQELNGQQLQQAQAESDWLTNTLRLVALTGGFDAVVGKQKE